MPKINAVLYTDIAICHDDFFLNSTESLHPLHAENMRKHLVKKEIDGRPAGFRLKELHGLPTFAEVTKLVESMKGDEKAEMEKLEAKMRLADAAGSTGPAGGMAVTQTFHHDALLAALSSRSRFLDN